MSFGFKMNYHLDNQSINQPRTLSKIISSSKEIHIRFNKSVFYVAESERLFCCIYYFAVRC
jgi:hypothetical protein